MINKINLDDINKLYEYGFVHLEKAVGSKDVIAVRDYLDNLFDVSEQVEDQSFRRYVISEEITDGQICEVNHSVRLNRKLKESALFKGCQQIASELLGRNSYRSYDHAIFKSCNSGRVLWHQDQAYKKTVNNMQSIVVWVPLQDVSQNEGCMQYISLKSVNRLLPHLKHCGSGTLYTDIPDSMPRYTCEAKMGDLIVHMPLTVHGSLPNRSKKVRKAWSIHFGPYGRLEAFMPSNFLHLVKSILNQMK